MAHLDRHMLERANTVVLLGIVWGALAGCAIAALVYDIGYWFEAW